MNNKESKRSPTINQSIKLEGEAAQKVYDRMAHALSNEGVKISINQAIEKLILGK